MQPESHELFDFWRSVTDEMAREYDRIQKRVSEDPGTAGDQGEENWATLFRGWLPPIYQVVTKGRILSHNGIAGPQVDVLILHPAYPRQLLDKKLYLAGGVAAAFECKVTLRAEHILSAMRNSAEINQHLPKRTGSLYKELHSSIVCGLLAHSHEWKGEKSTPLDNITKHLGSADAQSVNHPREMLDLVCVSDLATWVASKRPWFRPDVSSDDVMQRLSALLGSSVVLMTGYTRFSLWPDNERNFTPIGVMLTHLLRRLALEDPTVRKLAQYFLSVESGRTGVTSLRAWQSDIYSDKLKEMTMPELIARDEWEEWGGWAWAF